MHQFTIALVEDNGVNRSTFTQKIKSLNVIDVVFVAVNGNDCLEQLKGLPHSRQPQVIFMDLEMPGMNGIETIRIAKALYSNIHFIVLTVFDDDEKIFEAIRAGASGYLLKHEPASVLHESITNVLQFGGAPMSPAIARKTLRILSTAAPSVNQPAVNDLPQNITEREKEILLHMINGWDSKRISSELSISVLTIRKHIANIYNKLHVNSRAQVISLAHKNNWV